MIACVGAYVGTSAEKAFVISALDCHFLQTLSIIPVGTFVKLLLLALHHLTCQV